MSPAPQIASRGELREAGYASRTVREELRSNLISSLREGRRLFSGIHGYEHTVIPQVENAILAGHDIILLGERGQAKTRLARSLTTLLDEWMPVVTGSELNDDPLAPISLFARNLLKQRGEDMPVSWMSREDRFAEKLATPDATIADLIGDVDPIKVAEGRYLTNEEIIAYGLIPRTNRGIFNLNELPDLSERIQVGLLNTLEERDVQIRGFRIRLPLDIMFVASANPEDYTNRGRIITPLKDRFGSQIRTHYPQTVEHELRIVDQEHAIRDINGVTTVIPGYMRDMIATLSRLARSSGDVSQRSGVSVRMTIANYEAVASNAQRRALLLREQYAIPRITDLRAIVPSVMGKIEFETFDDGDDMRVLERLVGEAVREVFAPIAQEPWVREIADLVNSGSPVEVSDTTPAIDYIERLRNAADARHGLASFAGGDTPEAIASGLEFVLDGLYRSRKIGRESLGDGFGYGGAR